MTKPLRILLVEDSPSDAKLIIRTLKRLGRPLDTLRVDTREALQEALSQGDWDVVITDWSLPQFNALDTIAMLKAHALDVPVILVSGTIGEETAVDAVRAGASDFVLKDRLARLVPAIERELRDRQERASREQQLLLSEARFKRLAESGIIGIAFADIEGNVHDANDAYLRMLGFEREDLATGLMRWDALTPPEWREVDELAVAQLRANGVAPPWKKEMLRKDGTRAYVLLGVAMLDPPNCIAFAADLTHQRATELELHRSQDQFRHAQKMEAVGVLAGGVAHDFNNLLSVILAYTDMAMDALAESDPLRSDLMEVRRAGERAADLTRQLLAFSRRKLTQPKLFMLDEVVAGMEKMLQRLISEDITLRVEPSDGVCRVKADPGQVEQLVMNLAVNARDAMPEGGRLTIACAAVQVATREYPSLEAGGYVRLRVSDTGIGMDEPTKERIFDPFFTTKELGKGTGLGLSTVHGIVQQSGGQIMVHSQPSQGTTFDVYLPAVDDAAPGDAAQVLQPAMPGLTGSETILLVEDDTALRRAVMSILQRSGYAVIEAQSGGDALLIVEKQRGPIDLMLTDVVMPHMSGPQLADRLHTLHPSLRVLFMSGYVEDAALHHRLTSSGVPLLEKPFTTDTLRRTVRTVLDAPRRR